LVKLNESTAEQLCSWQVLPDLRTAIKELIDNSIDANCKSLTIEFNNFGLDGFEVADDGSGIDPEDFGKIAKKGTTSKITTFDDIYKVQTLGFRGEALAALRALGKLVIASKRASDKIGLEVTYDHNGDIISKVEKNMNVGSVVRVTELFKNVPVRYNEFHNNYKPQYKRAMELIQSYALSYYDLKFIVINKHPSKGTQTVFSKGSSESLDQNVELIYGKNALVSLNFDITPNTVTIKGYVKGSITSGSMKARARNILQMFLNKRPVHMPKSFSTAITEVYKKYNKANNPEAILFVNIEQHNGPKVDVNISPNKMDIIIEEEKTIAQQVNTQLEAFLNKTVPEKLQAIHEPLLEYKKSSSQEAKLKVRTEALKIPKRLDLSGASTKEFMKKSVKFSELGKFSTKLESEVNIEEEEKDPSYKCFEFKPKVNQESNTTEEVKVKDTIENIKANSQREGNSQKNEDCFVPKVIPINIRKDGSFNLDIIKLNTNIDKPTPEHCVNNISAQGTALKSQLSKIDFKKLRVIGQFNMGFILCSYLTELYIIDQHAADEKYNYERLASTTILQSQPLLKPLEVRLTSAEYLIAHQYPEVFEKNGFTVQIEDRIDNQTQQVHGVAIIKAMPHSENVGFTLDDFCELLGLITMHEGALKEYTKDKDKPILLRGGNTRPTKIRSMLASRACRRSVMVGTPLNHNEMTKIVRRLGELDCPWNCPHGRPTVRLLTKLN